MPLDKIITNFANSKAGHRFCSYIVNPKNEKFVNSTLPVAQTLIAELAGISIVAFNSKIEPEQKKSQLINHGLKAIANLTIVSIASKSITNFAQNIAKNLEKQNVAKSVQQGVKIGLPLLTTCILARYLIPVILNPISSKLRDKLNDKISDKNKKIDLKA